VCAVLYTTDPAASEAQLRSLARGLLGQGLRVVIVSSQRDVTPALQAELAQAGAELRTLGPRGPAPVAALLSLRQLTAILRRFRPSVLTVCAADTATPLLAVLAARIAGVPLVRAERGGGAARRARLTSALADAAFDRIIRANGASGNGNGHRLRQKRLELPGGVDLSRFEPERAGGAQARRLAGIADGTFVVMAFAPADDGPALELCRELARQLSLRRRRHCVILADVDPGDARPQARTEGRLALLRWPDGAAACLAAADVFVEAAVWSRGRSRLLEAMAMRRPVIVAGDDPAHRVVTDGVNGLVVAPGTPATLAEAARRLAVDAALARELGERARATVELRYSADLAMERLARLYRDLATA